MPNTFKEDLLVGQEVEALVLEKIKKKYPKAYSIEGYCKEYDIWIPELNYGIEVKQDAKSNYTGNIVIEIEMFNKPSALITTKAKYWVFYDQKKFVIIEVRDINTQKPIAAAKLTIIKSATEAFELKTNRDGKAEQVVPLGLYGVQCQASDYDTKIMEAYFNRTNNYLLIELGKRIIEEEEPVVAMVRPIAQEPIDEPRPRFVPKSTKTALVEEDKVIEQKKPTENYGGKAIDYDPFAEEEVEQVSEPEIEKEVFTQEPVLEEPEIVEPSVVEEPAKSTFVDNPQFSVREYKPNNIVFLIDRSVSMRNNDKLELLKQSMENLLGLLRPIDKLAVVVYATEAEVLIPSQTVENPQTFINLINGLTAGGMTNGAKGLREAFQEANNNFLDAGNNQVFLATDGAFSEGSDKIKSMAKRYGRRGISLSLIGVKNKEWTEKFLVEIADEGNGAYIHLSDESDAKFKLVEEIKQNSKIAGATRK